jgi:UDP-glucose 4-epimerase
MPGVRLIAISSAAVYGSDKSGPIPVNSLVTPLSPYAHHKRMMELLCSSYGTTYGVEFCVARLFSVYGPELKKQLLWDICERLSSGESPLVLGGTGQELRDWTHISDVVAALALIAFKYFSSNKGQTINIGTGLGITVREIAQLVIDRWQKKMGVFTKPDLQFSGQHRPGDPFSLVGDSLYLSQIGFSCQMPLTHGVHSFVDWFCKEKIC